MSEDQFARLAERLRGDGIALVRPRVPSRFEPTPAMPTPPDEVTSELDREKPS